MCRYSEQWMTIEGKSLVLCCKLGLFICLKSYSKSVLYLGIMILKQLFSKVERIREKDTKHFYKKQLVARMQI